MILLGCNIGTLLLNRLETSFRFIETNFYTNNNFYINTNTNTNTNNFINLLENKNSTAKITWFLSGGVKNNFNGAKSEASIMKSQIDNNITLKYTNPSISSYSGIIEWDFVLDEKSTNTAENLFWASHFINTTTKSFDSIYVITSDFHYKRTNLMLKLIDPSKNFKWILGDLEEKDSRYWESIHIKNVESDVSKAKTKLQALL
jgi:hypothetical protein